MQSVAKPPYAHDASAAHSQAFRIDWVAYLDAAKANSPTGSVALDPLMAKFLDEKCRAFDPSKELIQACKAMYWSADCVTEQAKMHCFKQFVGRAHVWSYAAQQMSVRLVCTATAACLARDLSDSRDPCNSNVLVRCCVDSIEFVKTRRTARSLHTNTNRRNWRGRRQTTGRGRARLYVRNGHRLRIQNVLFHDCCARIARIARIV